MGYAYQATVTIPAPTGGPHTDFTVVFKISSALLKPSPGGVIQHSGVAFTGGPTVPYDLIVSSDAAGTSLYNWTIKAWDQANGIAYIYVKIPNYSGALTLYVSIGNASVSSFPGGARGTAFDANTGLALLLPDGTTLNTADFSASANNGTNTGCTAASGQIDGGASLNGSTNKITFAQVIGAAAAAFTYECWINPTRYGNAAAGNAFFYQGPGTSQEGAAFMVYDGGGHTKSLRWSVANGGSYIYANNDIIALNAWQHVAFVYTVAGTTGTFYVNGVAAGSGSSGGTPPNTGGAIGYWYLSSDATRYFAGTLNDCRYSSVARSGDWIATEVANQTSIPLAGAFSPIVAGAPNSLTLVGCQ